MSYVFKRERDNEMERLTVKRRKHNIAVFEKVEYPHSFSGSYILDENEQGEDVVVFIILDFVDEELIDDLYEDYPSISVTYYGQTSTEIVVNRDLFWEEEFLSRMKKNKWMKYKVKYGTKNKEGKMKKIGVTNSMWSRLARILGIPTENEWMEGQQKKKKWNRIGHKKKQSSEN